MTIHTFSSKKRITKFKVHLIPVFVLVHVRYHPEEAYCQHQPTEAVFQGQ